MSRTGSARKHASNPASPRVRHKPTFYLRENVREFVLLYRHYASKQVILVKTVSRSLLSHAHFSSARPPTSALRVLRTAANAPTTIQQRFNNDATTIQQRKPPRPMPYARDNSQSTLTHASRRASRRDCPAA